MKKLFVVAAAAAFIVGCASDRYMGGEPEYGGTSEYAPDISGVQTNGPGMHSETRTGLPGPGTAGVSSGWTGAPIP